VKPIYLDDSLTEDELADAAAWQRNRAFETRAPGYTKSHGTVRRVGTLNDATDALRPYAAGETALKRWAADIVAWFSVVSPGGRVTAWRTGADSCIIETRD
jgi:hypothetical protein